MHRVTLHCGGYRLQARQQGGEAEASGPSEEITFHIPPPMMPPPMLLHPPLVLHACTPQGSSGEFMHSTPLAHPPCPFSLMLQIPPAVIIALLSPETLSTSLASAPAPGLPSPRPRGSFGTPPYSAAGGWTVAREEGKPGGRRETRAERGASEPRTQQQRGQCKQRGLS